MVGTGVGSFPGLELDSVSQGCSWSRQFPGVESRVSSSMGLKLESAVSSGWNWSLQFSGVRTGVNRFQDLELELAVFQS